MTKALKKKIRVRDVFGIFADWKTPTQKLKDEARKGWTNKKESMFGADKRLKKWKEHSDRMQDGKE